MPESRRRRLPAASGVAAAVEVVPPSKRPKLEVETGNRP